EMPGRPGGEATLRYLDARQDHGHTARYLIVDLGDGRWVIDSLVYTKKNGSRAPFADTADAFVAAFGGRAEQLSLPGAH
ncbi:MAG: hypothetical protein AAFY28_21610, partial [Actinomycetota bacterium]